MNAFLLSTLSAIALLTIAVVVAILAKWFKFPYTVGLVGAGIVIALVINALPAAGFLDDFRLTPEMLLYIFLPILLFEAAYNISYKDFFRNIRSISALSIVGLLISAIVIAFGLQWIFSLIGIVIPLSVTFLFGALISATDPVAVLALFKELWAPKRLTLIFEGESLFNDGTALALFLVCLAIILQISGADAGHSNMLVHALQSLGAPMALTGSLTFVSMIVAGIVFGVLIGFAFSQFIGRLKNEPFLELALTLALAHATYIGAEILNHFVLPVSGVIATTIAAMVLGNYGRYKISIAVEKTMGHFWEFFAFLANSFVFILVGIMIVRLQVSWLALALPIALTVITVMIARAVSVYSVVGVLNCFKSEAHIPASWQHLLSWGSLRWALAVIMVLLIPEDLTLPGWTMDISVRDFILALTVGCIVFTTFIKATTIFPLLKRFGLLEFGEDEEAEIIKWHLRMLIDVAPKLESMASAGRIPKDELDILRARYLDQVHEAEKGLHIFLGRDPASRDMIIRQTIARHAIGLERFWLKELFTYGEISEHTFKILLRKLEEQSYRISVWKPQIRPLHETKPTSFVEKIADRFYTLFGRDRQREYITRYLKARARSIVASRVLRDLGDLDCIPFLRDSVALAEIREVYREFGAKAQNVRETLFVQYRSILLPLDSQLAAKSLALTKLRALDALVEKGTLSTKVAHLLREETEHELFEGPKIA